jgi:hypothetical protein
MVAMADVPPQGHVKKRTKEEIIARQNAEAHKMFNSDHHRRSKPSHEVPALGHAGFFLTAAVGIVFSFLINYMLATSGLLSWSKLLVYSSMMAVIAIISFVNLKNEKDPSPFLCALFLFSAISTFGIWSIFGGAMAILIFYLLMQHEKWV